MKNRKYGKSSLRAHGLSFSEQAVNPCQVWGSKAYAEGRDTWQIDSTGQLATGLTKENNV